MLLNHDAFRRAGADDEHRRKKFVAEPTEVLEDVPLEEGNPEKFTRIGTSMEDKTKQYLVQFLRENIRRRGSLLLRETMLSRKRSRS